MKKRTYLMVLAVIMLFILSACVCEHQWKDADCLAPKTCSQCEETEGEPLGHDWLPAECTLPERCSRCEETMGDALGHTWVEADCVTPKTCSVCAETEGETLGHTWVEADCVTPKTCSVCAETEGEALGHTWVEADCVTPKTCSVCAETEGEAFGHTWVDASCSTPEICSSCGKTQGEERPHTYGQFSIRDEQMVHTCEECQVEETLPLDYDAYLQDRLAGEWFALFGHFDGELYELPQYSLMDNSHEYVFMYLNFIEDHQVQVYSEGLDTKYHLCAWTVDEASLTDEFADSYAIRLSLGEEDTLVFQYEDELQCIILAGLDFGLFNPVYLLKENPAENIAHALSRQQWKGYDSQREEQILKFNEDYTFTGQILGEEVSGSWFFRCIYVEAEVNLEADIVLSYQKEGRPCLVPMRLEYDIEITGDDEHNIQDVLNSLHYMEAFNKSYSIRYRICDE